MENINPTWLLWLIILIPIILYHTIPRTKIGIFYKFEDERTYSPGDRNVDEDGIVSYSSDKYLTELFAVTSAGKFLIDYDERTDHYPATPDVPEKFQNLIRGQEYKFQILGRRLRHFEELS